MFSFVVSDVGKLVAIAAKFSNPGISVGSGVLGYKEGEIHLLAYSGRIQVEIFVEEIEGSGVGEIIIDFKVLAEYLSSCHGSVCFLGEENSLKVKALTSEITLSAIELEEYPGITGEIDWVDGLTLSREDVQDLDYIRFAADTKKLGGLSGIHIFADQGRVIGATTDGRRIAETYLSKNGEIETAVTVPGQDWSAIEGCLSMMACKDIELSWNSGLFGVEAEFSEKPGWMRFTGMVLSGFPSYYQAINLPVRSQFQVDLATLKSSVYRAMSLFVKERSPAEFIVSDVLTISAKSQYGNITEKLECEGSGDFNFMLDLSLLYPALTKVKKTEKISCILLEGPYLPIFFSWDNYRYILFGMKSGVA